MQGFLLVCPQINGIMKREKKEAGYEKAYDTKSSSFCKFHFAYYVYGTEYKQEYGI